MSFAPEPDAPPAPPMSAVVIPSGSLPMNPLPPLVILTDEIAPSALVTIVASAPSPFPVKENNLTPVEVVDGL